MRWLWWFLIPIVLASCSTNHSTRKQSVTIVLDWMPNTNHTGLYVARDKGFFAKEGLDVAIRIPAQTSANQLVGANQADFGISSQEYVTQARAEGIPIVSIAAILQHNTSGFAAHQSKKIHSLRDWLGKTYGGWGTPLENAFIKTLLQAEGLNPNKVKMVNIGQADFFAASKHIDFSWIYYGWTGVEAEVRRFPIDFIALRQLDPDLDFYTPTIITSEKTLRQRPETVRKCLAAVQKGYYYAIKHPRESADILLKASPETDRKLAYASQEWLKSHYISDAPRWGVQTAKRWRTFTEWMWKHNLIKKKINSEQAFSNDYLPR